MALHKPLRSTYGVNAKYWIVKDVLVDKARRMARVTVGGYPSQDIRNEDSDPLMKLTVNVNFEKFDEFFNLEKLDAEGNNIYKIAYEAIKKYDAFFKDADDLI